MRFFFALLFSLLLNNVYCAAQSNDGEKADTAAQEEEKSYWSFENDATLYLSQIAYSEYWKGSGFNNITFGGAFDWKAIYKKDKNNFTYSTNIQYGLMKRDKQEWIKNRDKLEMTGNYGYKFSDKMFLSAVMTTRTFMTETYKINKAGMRDAYNGKFASPLTIDIGSGLNVKNLLQKKDEEETKNKLDIYYTPINGKITVVRDSLSAVQYLPEKFREDMYRFELGSLVKFVASFTLMENITLQSRADFFTNHLSNFGNFDVNIESKIKMKVNNHITVDILGNLIYDEDIQFEIFDENGEATGRTGPRTQFSESINVGLTHSF
ncbi:DUF3078 domain-containing protein [Membranihabitans maritimus]|uniref:DUF3078 domain-containing protein n=1 Tax=Membranihabitans maritimus TaxID=2904244 RepID=UPI001F1BD351|nr:DUF3078 domain-containing protein [Membranihabitans maritimus]